MRKKINTEAKKKTVRKNREKSKLKEKTVRIKIKTGVKNNGKNQN